MMINKKILMTFFTEDWTLQIAPVLLEDDALFQCQVTPGEKKHHTQNLNITQYEYKPPTKYEYKYKQI